MAAPGITYDIVLQTGNGQNLLTYSLVAGAMAYTVQRSTDGVTFSTLGTSSTNSYLDTTCLIGVQYYYQVAATNSDGNSSFMPSEPSSIVPCLPGQSNLGYLRYMSQLKADFLNNPFLTLDEWNWNINQSIFEFFDILVTKYGDDFFLASPYTFTTTGSNSYNLPDGSPTFAVDGITPPAVYKMLGADCGVAIGNNAWVTLPRYNWIDRNKFVYPQLTANALGVYNLSYRQMGNKIYFIPPPAAGQYIQIWYVPILSKLLRDTDMLSFSISGWDEYVIIDAAIKALGKEESDVSLLMAQKQQMLERIETTAANRDIGQPNTISDTRGNAGFGPGGGGSWGPWGGQGGY